MTHVMVPDERRRRLASGDNLHVSERYDDAQPCSDLNISVASLKSTLDRTCSQSVSPESIVYNAGGQVHILKHTLQIRNPLWLELQPADIKSRWRHNWKSAQVVNSHLVCDPAIRQPGFDLPRQQWSLLNRFRTEQGHCGACRRKWRLTHTDLCPCSETQTMSHTVESCPLTELNGGLSRLHSADEDVVSWLTNYGS